MMESPPAYKPVTSEEKPLVISTEAQLSGETWLDPPPA